MTSMEQLQMIACAAKQEGLSYGQYVKLHGEEYSKPEQSRICGTCGKPFVPPLLKNGEVSKKRNCESCTAANRERRGMEPAHHFTKVYITQCAKCGSEVETRRSPGSWHKNYCPECREEEKRRSTRESAARWRKKQRSGTEKTLDQSESAEVIWYGTDKSGEADRANIRTVQYEHIKNGRADELCTEFHCLSSSEHQAEERV